VGLYRLWVLPTLEIAFGMGSSKVSMDLELFGWSTKVKYEGVQFWVKGQCSRLVLFIFWRELQMGLGPILRPIFNYFLLAFQ